MRKVETLFGLIIVLGFTAAVAVWVIGAWHARQEAPQPSGVWAGLVDDLPSGRLVECVFATHPMEPHRTRVLARLAGGENER